MSDFQQGARQLHAINAAGESVLYAATSPEVSSNEELYEWANAEAPKFSLPEGASWQLVESSDHRFVQEENKPVPNPVPVATAPPVAPLEPKNSMIANAKVENVGSQEQEPPKKGLKQVQVDMSGKDFNAVQEHRKQLFEKRHQEEHDLDAQIAKHMKAFKQRT